MSLAASPGRITASCIAVLVLMPVLVWWRGTQSREAIAAYEREAAGAPTAVYRVADTHSQTTGSGKSRKTTYTVELAWVEGDTNVPRGLAVDVGPSAYEGAAPGSRWRARAVQGRALFDPRLTRVELDAQRHTRNVAIGVAIVAVLVLVANLKGWLHRAL